MQKHCLTLVLTAIEINSLFILNINWAKEKFDSMYQTSMWIWHSRSPLLPDCISHFYWNVHVLQLLPRLHSTNSINLLGEEFNSWSSGWSLLIKVFRFDDLISNGIQNLSSWKKSEEEPKVLEFSKHICFLCWPKLYTLKEILFHGDNYFLHSCFGHILHVRNSTFLLLWA